MIPCVIFLNELSYRDSSALTSGEIVPILLSTLHAIRAAQKLRQDLIVIGDSPISKIAIGDGTHSFASLLCGNIYKEEWRFIRGLDQSSPENALWRYSTPNQLEEVTYKGRSSIGMLWANRHQSLVLSLGFPPHWDTPHIEATLEVIINLGNFSATDIIVSNIATPEHANHHNELIAHFGMDVSSSSVIYQGDEFVARMYFHDHDPPHFHVFLPSDPTRTLATYRITTLDILSGHLTPGMQRRVREWAGNRKEQLLDNWSRCRNGQHPVLMND